MAHEFEIVRKVVLEATPEQVWEAIATGPGLTAWLFPMDLDAGDPNTTTWDPPKRLAIRTPPAEDGATQAFEYLIEAGDGGSTVLRFVHSGFTDGDWSAEYDATAAAGWDMYLHTLGQYLRHFPGRAASFVSADAPASSSTKDAWQVLLAALGVSATPQQGDRVSLAPAGLPPVEGVVDYATDHFLGIRTSDALYRFHGRWMLGMTIAAGHHLYGDDVAPDVATTQAAWQGWLDQVFAA